MYAKLGKTQTNLEWSLLFQPYPDMFLHQLFQDVREELNTNVVREETKNYLESVHRLLMELQLIITFEGQKTKFFIGYKP